MSIEYYPTTPWHDIGSGLSWRHYKHWADGHLAAEGITDVHGDHSGCLEVIGDRKMTTVPLVVEARRYFNHVTEQYLSAVFSYPKGLSMEKEYFWEIYPNLDGDIQRFFGLDAEKEMETVIIELLLNPTYRGMSS